MSHLPGPRKLRRLSAAYRDQLLTGSVTLNCSDPAEDRIPSVPAIGRSSVLTAADPISGISFFYMRLGVTQLGSKHIPDLRDKPL